MPRLQGLVLLRLSVFVGMFMSFLSISKQPLHVSVTREDETTQISVPPVLVQQEKSSSSLAIAATASSAETAHNEDSTSLAELQRRFYDYHYGQLHNQPIENLIVWESAVNYMPKNARRTFGPFFDGVSGLYKHPHKLDWRLVATEMPNSTKALYLNHHQGICEAARLFFEFYQNRTEQFPHVLITHLHEDRGAMSTYIPGRNGIQRFDIVKAWKKEGCSQDYVRQYLDHPHTHAVITSQFHIWDHPKVHSLPLGFQFQKTAVRLKDQLQKYGKNPVTASQRPQLLMVNSKKRDGMRTQLLNATITTFTQRYNHSLKNTYGRGNMNGYLDEMSSAKFIMSPSGTGIDCYRHWEALMLGCIPVLETWNRSDGWMRTFDGLPVAWIDSYYNMTPAWLEDQYWKILQTPPEDYQWKKLTRKYWIGEWLQSLSPSTGFEPRY